VGLDATNSYKHSEILKMVIQHVRDLRAIPNYRYAYVFVYIEANLSWTIAEDIARTLNNVPELAPLRVVSRDSSSAKRPGVWTREHEKRMFVKVLERVLRTNTISYAAKMAGSNLEKDKESLQEQLCLYRMESKPPNDLAHGRERISFTGKAAGMKDDLALTLQMVVYHLMFEEQLDEYQRLAARLGWPV